jgi:hypothetical protein
MAYQANRAALRASAADAALFDAEQAGPGDAYRLLWLQALDFKANIRQARDEQRRDQLINSYIQTLRIILPYERPRLQTVKMEGDPNKPTLPPEDVAKAMAAVLTKEELKVLDVVAMKIITGSPSPRQTTGIVIDEPSTRQTKKPRTPDL